MKVYIASPFFTQQQLKDVGDLEVLLIKGNIDFFSPRLSNGSMLYQGGEGEDCTEEMIDTVKSIVFVEDLAEMHTCDVLMVNGRNLDSGTLFELGYATSKGLLVQFFGGNVLEMKEYYSEMKTELQNFIESMHISDINRVIFNKLAYFDEDLNTIFIKSESTDVPYHGISKFLLGYLYDAYGKKVNIIYFDKPRKSNLMLTSAVTVYEYDNMDMNIINLTSVYLDNYDKFTKVYGRKDN